MCVCERVSEREREREREREERESEREREREREHMSAQSGHERRMHIVRSTENERRIRDIM